MATPSNPDKDWVYSEAVRRSDTLDVNMRVAIRAHEGWVKVLDLLQDGWMTTELPTRRQVLENIQETITIELAKLTLEET